MVMSISRIKALHYVKLVFRLCVFTAAAILYAKGALLTERYKVAAFIVWLLFFAETVCRLFPSKNESMGCQKQFAKNFIPNGGSQTSHLPYGSKRLALTAALWTVLVIVIGAFYGARIIDKGALLLISLGFAVCDMVCVLFFCPFQKWLLGHRCCVTCRIYNWDYIMMFSPLIFIRSAFTWALVLAAAMVLVRWEITAFRHRERFYEQTNLALSCSRCREKNCRKI